MNYGKIKVGDKVKTLKKLQNGAIIIPAGSIGVVERLYGGLSLYFEVRCPHCNFGWRYWITRVNPSDVELIVEDTNGK